MKTRNLFFALLLMLTTNTFAGGIVGNGGDTLYCRSSQLTPESGYYNLDYMFAVLEGTKPEDFVTVSRWKESALHIKAILARADQKLASDFEKFYTGSLPVLNQGPQFIGYSWLPAKETLKPVKDEGALFRVPEECKLKFPGDVGLQPVMPDEFFVVQTVIRSELMKEPILVRTYNYSEAVFVNLTQNPLQLSMMFVHEWGWNLTSDVETVRKLNQFLHLKSTNYLTGEEILARLRQIGIAIN